MSATLSIDSRSKGSVAVPAKLLLEFLKLFKSVSFTIEDKYHRNKVLTQVNMLLRMLLVRISKSVNKIHL
jgi:hypothetical protein